MNPFKRMMQRLGLLRAPSRGREKLLQPYEDDSGDAAAGGVPARLPRVPPRYSPGNALTIPREPEITEARATDTI
ncbi:MAG TPA: hypothetical protein VN224_11345 [Xanthomonadales bacterium]|nr:hypothetical protein [Xanthomonadales bacterium]